MKSILYTSILATIILLSSCSSLGLTKRKYRKGYHWSIAKTTNTQDKNALAHSTEKKKDMASNVNFKPEALSSITAVSVSDKSKETELKPTFFSNKSIKLKTQNNSNTLSASKTNLKTKKLLKPTPALPKSKPLSKAKDNDIILILCCLFIPPLGVFLFQDDITIDFWIDLILCLLFWLPGIIFAFLVCFADVSLQ